MDRTGYRLIAIANTISADPPTIGQYGDLVVCAFEKIGGAYHPVSLTSVGISKVEIIDDDTRHVALPKADPLLAGWVGVAVAPGSTLLRGSTLFNGRTGRWPHRAIAALSFYVGEGRQPIDAWFSVDRIFYL